MCFQGPIYTSVRGDCHSKSHVHQEFVTNSFGDKAVCALPAFQTPRRYTLRSCTLVIARLTNFTPGLILDEPPPLPHGRSDIAFFASMWSAARAIDHLCIRTHGSMGLAMLGRFNHCIRVFLWATKSAMNPLVPIERLAWLYQTANAFALIPSLENTRG